MWSLLSTCGDGLLRTIKGSCLEACVVQDRCQRLGDHGFIIYNEDGAQIGTALANIANLEAGGRWAFRAVAFRRGDSYKLSKLSGY